nr:cation transporter [Nocardia farcinica]
MTVASGTPWMTCSGWYWQSIPPAARPPTPRNAADVDPTGNARTPLAVTSAGPQRRALLARRIRWLVAATITYNVIEAIVAITEGARVSSTALIGFGLDWVIEVTSAAAVAWQFAGRDPEKREKIALRIIAFSYFALATYVTVESVRGLLGVGDAEPSMIGIVLAGVSLAIMPVLSWAQRRAGRELGSASAVADSKQTLLCTYLSAVLLIGLLLNSLFWWSGADPIAALVIAALEVGEGIKAWRGTLAARTPPRSSPRRWSPAHTTTTAATADLSHQREQRRPDLSDVW